MPRQDVLETIRKYTDPFRVTKGKDFRLKDFDPGDTRGLKMDKQEAAELLAARFGMARNGAGHSLRPGLLGAAAHLPGDGRGGQGRHDQARHVAASIRRAARSFASSSRRTRSCRSRLPVALRREVCPSAAASASSIALTTRKCSSCVCTRSCSRRRSCRRSSSTSGSGTSGLPTSRASRTISRGNGYVVLKFFLNVSKEEQKKRFLERLDKPDKNWKFSAADVRERTLLGRLHARLRGGDPRDGTKDAPWYVVPADNKWFTRLVVAAANRGGERVDLGHERFDKPARRPLREQTRSSRASPHPARAGLARARPMAPV